MSSVVITWPKSKSLEDYLAALEEAKQWGDYINYRIANCPKEPWNIERCYVVHNGYVRGWSPVVRIEQYGEYKVLNVDEDDYWPAGWYIVRRPDWHPIEPIPMKGFQGWRYFDDQDCELFDGEENPFRVH